jgi:hypothetical protein
MRTSAEIKDELLQTFEESLDKPLKTASFVRNKRAFVYVRKLNDADQCITFVAHCHPKYQPEAEAHIYPALQLTMPLVNDMARTLVKHDNTLLAGAPEILSQPIDFTAPKAMQQRWFATGKEQFLATCHSIEAFLSRWVLPFLSEVSLPSGLVKLYETNDMRIVKSHKWHIFVAAAYQVLEQQDKAREVVRQQFGSQGLRRRYASLFDSLGIEE